MRRSPQPISGHANKNRIEKARHRTTFQARLPTPPHTASLVTSFVPPALSLLMLEARSIWELGRDGLRQLHGCGRLPKGRWFIRFLVFPGMGGKNDNHHCSAGAAFSNGLGYATQAWGAGIQLRAARRRAQEMRGPTCREPLRAPRPPCQPDRLEPGPVCTPARMAKELPDHTRWRDSRWARRFTGPSAGDQRLANIRNAEAARKAHEPRNDRTPCARPTTGAHPRRSIHAPTASSRGNASINDASPPH